MEWVPWPWEQASATQVVRSQWVDAKKPRDPPRPRWPRALTLTHG